MKVLILGGDGMLGHELFFQLRQRHDTHVTLRQALAAYTGYRLFERANAFDSIDVRKAGAVERVLEEYKPQAVINAVGIVKQRPESEESLMSIEVNSLLPHRLAIGCKNVGAHLVHLSTDCVFSGKQGAYREKDLPDPVDVYGRSKLLGEVAGDGALTLRTSMIGRGLTRKDGLIDWFLAQRAPIQGYRNAIFSGLTTRELARVIGMLIEKHPKASGLYHVSADSISKLDLLMKLRARLGSGPDIVPVDEPRINRSLDSTRFRNEFGYAPPSWDQMLDELAQDIHRKAA